jgi:hypothetical protein
MSLPHITKNIIVRISRISESVHETDEIVASSFLEF